MKSQPMFSLCLHTFHYAPQRGLSSEVRHCAFALQPNCKFNVDANSGHAFSILLAAVGTLRPSGSGAS
jgi:hypothetical protein